MLNLVRLFLFAALKVNSLDAVRSSHILEGCTHRPYTVLVRLYGRLRTLPCPGTRLGWQATAVSLVNTESVRILFFTYESERIYDHRGTTLRRIKQMSHQIKHEAL